MGWLRYIKVRWTATLGLFLQIMLVVADFGDKQGKVLALHDVTQDVTSSRRHCCAMYVANPSIVIGQTWGTLAEKHRRQWQKLNCDQFATWLRRVRNQHRPCTGSGGGLRSGEGEDRIHKHNHHNTQRHAKHGRIINQGRKEAMKPIVRAASKLVMAKKGTLSRCLQLYLDSPSTHVGVTWGKMPKAQQQEWATLDCDRYRKRLVRARRTADCTVVAEAAGRVGRQLDARAGSITHVTPVHIHEVVRGPCTSCKEYEVSTKKLLYGPDLSPQPGLRAAGGMQHGIAAVFTGYDVYAWWDWKEFSCVFAATGTLTAGHLRIAHVSDEVLKHGAMDAVQIPKWGAVREHNLTGSAAVVCPIPEVEVRHLIAAPATATCNFNVMSSTGKILVADASVSVDTNAERRYNMSACVFTMEHDPLALIEWIEWMRHVARVEHFFLYDNGISTAVAAVVQRYVASGFVTVENWRGLRHFPDGCDPAVCVFNRVQEVILNHALLKYGPTSTWMAFFDTDEFFVPAAKHRNTSLFHIVESVARPSDAAVKFRTWPFTRCCPDDTDTWRIPWMRFTAQCNQSWSMPQEAHEKNVIRPALVDMWNNIHSMRDKPYFSDVDSTHGKLAHFARKYSGQVTFHGKATGLHADGSMQALVREVIMPHAAHLCTTDGVFAGWHELCTIN